MGESPPLTKRTTGLRYAAAMHPFEVLLPGLNTLRTPAVRDLAWTLCAPALLDEPGCPQRHPLQGSAWAADPAALRHWLDALDAEPGELLQTQAQIPGFRLGLYHERLWQFALRAAPGIELLAANLAVREAGRTLGELDLLLRDGEGDWHLELAVKFYLGTGGSAWSDWIGPGGDDRLDLKLAHLRSHQLPLAAKPQARPLLPTQRPVQSRVWLIGNLFAAADAPRAAGAHPSQPRGAWQHLSHWQPPEQPHWAILPRLRWLSPARLDADSLRHPSALRAELQAHDAPRLLARLAPGAHGWEEVERLFVVPEGWPVVAPP